MSDKTNRVLVFLEPKQIFITTEPLSAWNITEIFSVNLHDLFGLRGNIMSDKTNLILILLRTNVEILVL
jgi:hypothetical protein